MEVCEGIYHMLVHSKHGWKWWKDLASLFFFFPYFWDWCNCLVYIHTKHDARRDNVYIYIYICIIYSRSDWKGRRQGGDLGINIPFPKL